MKITFVSLIAFFVAVMLGLASAVKICTPEDRLARCVTYRPVEGCICTHPDVCKTGRADTCSICLDKKVYSFAPGVKC